MSAKPWYAWFPADYRAKTSHLTFEQDGAYRRLIDAYYERRGPLPIEPPTLYRLASAQSDSERRAIDSVVGEFFTNGEGVLRHTRCDEQITKEEALHKAWVEAGRKGGLRQAQARLNHPIPRPRPRPRPRLKPRLTEDQKPKSIVALTRDDTHLEQAKEILQYLNHNANRNYRAVPANLNLITARLKSGATALQIREIIFAKCREWGKDAEMIKYLRPATLFNTTKFEQYLGELNAMPEMPQRTG